MPVALPSMAKLLDAAVAKVLSRRFGRAVEVVRIEEWERDETMEPDPAEFIDFEAIDAASHVGMTTGAHMGSLEHDSSTREPAARPLFVIGSGRCGTTHFAARMATHPAYVSLPFEPRLIARPDTLVRLSDAGLSMEKRAALQQYLLDRFLFDGMPRRLGFHIWFSDDDYRSAVVRLLTGSDDAIVRGHAFLDTIFGRVMEREGAAYWIDDTPTNGLVIPEILQFYPELEFVHLIRDGREVAQSFVRLGWENKKYDRALAECNGV